MAAILLQGERLVLRNFNDNDGMDLYEYLSDKEVVRYEPYDVYTEEMAHKEAGERANNPSFIAVCLKDSGKVIGNLYLNKIEPEKVHTYEIGYVFNRSYHGLGYATEACRYIVEYVFGTLYAHRIIANCNSENTASWKLLERLGFRREAHRVKNMFFEVDGDGNPKWFSSCQYALLKEEYKK